MRSSQARREIHCVTVPVGRRLGPLGLGVVWKGKVLDTRLTERIDRERLRVLFKAGSGRKVVHQLCGWALPCGGCHSLACLPNEANSVLVALTKPENAACANANARTANGGYGLEAVVERACSNDLVRMSSSIPCCFPND